MYILWQMHEIDFTCFRRPRGMYFCRKDRGEMASMVYNWESDQVLIIIIIIITITTIIIITIIINILLVKIIIIKIIMASMV